MTTPPDRHATTGDVGMNLNHATTPTHPSQDALASSPSEKKAAATAIEKHIHPDTLTAGDYADEKTNTAVKEFDARDGDGWVTSTALRKAHKEWGKQVKSLLERLDREQSMLVNTNLLFTGTDGGVGTTLRPPSALDDF